MTNDEKLIEDLTGALQFILAFYEPGQTHLDTKAWEQAQRAGEMAYIKGCSRLSWTRRSFPWERTAWQDNQ